MIAGLFSLCQYISIKTVAVYTGSKERQTDSNMKKIVASNFDITGDYILDNDKLKPVDNTKTALTIRQRKETGKGKSRYFLAVQENNKPFMYISGLFDNAKGETVATKSYNLDYGNTYTLDFRPNDTHIIGSIRKVKD
jgi:hypothetical protein